MRECWIQEPVFAICTSSTVNLVCPAKFCIIFVFYFSWVLHSSQEKLNFCSKNAAALMKFFYGKMRLLFEGGVYFSESWTQNKNCFKYGIITVKPPLQTPHYHGQFALSLGKESPYILSKFNPLNTDTFSGPLKGPINGVWLDFRIRLTELTSLPRRLLTFLVPNAGLMQGWSLILGDAYSSKFKNLFMLSVRISSYGCTREVWRARKMRKSCTRR